MADRTCSASNCDVELSPFSRSANCVLHRFWSFVSKSADDGCWNWTGGKDWDGYAIFAAEGRRTVRAHRWIFTRTRGRVPDGLHLDHLCRNRACVNPAHLEPVTSLINTLRGEGLAAVNTAKTHCLRGHPLGPDGNVRVANGRRHCRECARLRMAAKRAQQRGDLRAKPTTDG